MGMQNLMRFPESYLRNRVQTTRELIHSERVLPFCRAGGAPLRGAETNLSHRARVCCCKTVRSVQAHLHDFLAALGGNLRVAPASWSEARLKLKHTAFIELNQRAILEVAYGGKMISRCAGGGASA